MTTTAIAAPPTAQMLTLQQVGHIFGVSKDVVRNWIARGELRAVNTSADPGSLKPRFRVTSEAVEEFQAARCNIATALPEREETPPATRRRQKDPNVIEFYR